MEEIKEEQERLIQDLQQIREHKGKVQEELSFQNNENVLKLIRAFNKEF